MVKEKYSRELLLPGMIYFSLSGGSNDGMMLARRIPMLQYQTHQALGPFIYNALQRHPELSPYLLGQLQQLGA